MNPIDLNIFSSRLEAVCDEMGEVLRAAAFSTNIRDRLDYSCAVFDARGGLCAQAAHIPVHLGSMAYAMADIVADIDWNDGDMVILNDPYLGGTHLPDVTLIAPVFVQDSLVGFVVNRAHHADIGAGTPGSMPVSSNLYEEGQVIEPVKLYRDGQRDRQLFATITNANRSSTESAGDLSAQISANLAGVRQLTALVSGYDNIDLYFQRLAALNDYAEKLAAAELQQIPDGCYEFTDYLDDDGQGNRDIAISLRLSVENGQIVADFDGTSPQVSGNVNCPLSVAAAAVLYVFRCLMPVQMPACASAFRAIDIRAPQGSLLNAQRPHAVAAGNVETSTRVVDVVLGALAQALPLQIPAASHGSMNNVAMGATGESNRWDYYETIGGGMGAGAQGGGLSAVQTHMTNTLNTPIEVLESRFPLLIERYAIRRNSGGPGQRNGGDGLLREYRFLQPAHVSLLTERRSHRPWGLADGGEASLGRNLLNGNELAAKQQLQVQAGDVLTIETPGGGAYGRT
ncbi:MAG: hydantoinase B/oxoprolinase family protein [Chromatiales bacterium]|jgi:N-methylhydantoinase B